MSDEERKEIRIAVRPGSLWGAVATVIVALFIQWLASHDDAVRTREVILAMQQRITILESATKDEAAIRQQISDLSAWRLHVEYGK